MKPIRYIVVNDPKSYNQFIAQLKEDIKFSQYSTQEAIAKLIRVSRATLNRMLNGEGVDFGRALQIEALLGYQVVVLPKGYAV